MNTEDFLSKILPSEGNICITTIQGKAVLPFFADDVQEASDHVKANSKTIGANLYYAMSTFTVAGSRKQDNVKFIKSFWIDLDCGTGTPYRNPDEGLSALQDFVDLNGLPDPLVVCSGNGLHVYWPLKESITRAQWQPIATRIPTLCEQAGLSVKDPGCSVDSARIFRVPNTKNYKNLSSPIDVRVMQDAEPVEFEEFKAAFETALGTPLEEPQAVITTVVPYDSTTLAINRPTTASFAKILLSGRCNQVMQTIQERATLTEPRWRALLSIAQCCTDRAKAINIISVGHPDYNYADAERKASLTKGPYKCTTFKQDNPAGCAGCKEMISSPIQLGEELIEATSNEVVVHELVENEDAELVSAPKTYSITPYPFPYKRGVNGGIFVEGLPGPDGAVGKLECVHENDLYAVGRYHDTTDGESVLCRYHLPHDGVREFILPLRTVVTTDKLRDALAMEGVVASKKNMDRILHMLSTQIRGLQKMASAKVSRRQFGWQDMNKCFVAGDREIRADDILYSPPSSATANIVPAFQTKGSLEAWKKAVNVLNQPGFEIQAFTFMVGLGVPLINFTGQKGFCINLVSEQSGTGKTTTLNMINSIWGNPVDMMLLEQDTNNSRMHRMGIYCHIGACIDEITNLDALVLSDLLYAISNGRDKHRMQASVNQERVNSSQWSSATFTTANATCRDKLASGKAKSEGENMRLLEFYVNLAGNYSKDEADAIFRPILSNYGWAGPEFIQAVLSNFDGCLALLKEEEARFNRDFGTLARERMWAAAFCSGFTAMKIARSAGLLDWDIERIRTKMMIVMQAQRHDVEEAVEDPNDTLGNFLREHISNIVIVDSGSSSVLNLDSIAQTSARQQIVARFDKHDKSMFIAQSAFRDYCTKRQISFPMMLDHLKKQAFWMGIETRRLGSGIGLVLPPIRVIHLHGEFDFV